MINNKADIRTSATTLDSMVAEALGTIHTGRVTRVMEWGAEATILFRNNGSSSEIPVFVRPEYDEQGARIPIYTDTDVVLMPVEALTGKVGEANIEAIVFEPNRGIGQLSQGLLDFESRYSQYIQELPTNNTPYNSLWYLVEGMIGDVGVYLKKCSQNLDFFTKAQRGTLSDLTRRYNSLHWRMTEVAEHIGNILDALGGEDQRIFDKDIIATLTKEPYYKEGKHNGAEIYAVVGVTGILIPPVRYDSFGPAYWIKDEVLGARKIRLKKVHEDGVKIEAEVVDDPTAEQLKSYYSDLIKRSKSASDINEILEIAMSLEALHEYAMAAEQDQVMNAVLNQSGIPIDKLGDQADSVYAKYYGRLIKQTGRYDVYQDGQIIVSYSADGSTSLEARAIIYLKFGAPLLNNNKYKSVWIERTDNVPITRALNMALVQKLPAMFRSAPPLKDFKPLHFLSTFQLPSEGVDVPCRSVTVYHGGPTPVYVYRIGK